VAVERVHDDRRPCVPGEQRGGAADGSGLGGVGVQDVRPDLADQPCEPQRRDDVARRRDLAVQLVDAHDVHAELVRDERHRVLPGGEAARDQRRLVAALRKAGGEIGDVQRRPAHIEPRDDP